jgi:tRNA pseudouridine38-40 synthase
VSVDRPTWWLKLTVAYDGTAYAGWQIQPAVPTIQAAVEAAWQQITGERVSITASGRTDAGVHAEGQVVGVRTNNDLSCERLLMALNARLPEDIVVRSVELAPTGFHATHDALRKTYRYHLCADRVRPLIGRHTHWHVRQPLDVTRMQQAALPLVGRHDFACFESTGSARDSTIRTIVSCDVLRLDAQRIMIEVTGDGFLYNMVRAIAGTLVEVGRGVQPIDWIRKVLASRDRGKAGPTAPAHGLVLWNVDYWNVDYADLSPANHQPLTTNH